MESVLLESITNGALCLAVFAGLDCIAHEKSWKAGNVFAAADIAIRKNHRQLIGTGRLKIYGSSPHSHKPLSLGHQQLSGKRLEPCFTLVSGSRRASNS